MQLSPDQERISESIKDILVKKNPDGEYTYTKLEIRDFIVAAVFELKLPTPKEIEKHILEFLSQFQLPEAATDEEIETAVRGYYQENPLNPELMKEFEAVGRSSLLTKDEGYKETAEQIQAMRSVGNEENLQAPEEKVNKKKPKLKKGLS